MLQSSCQQRRCQPRRKCVAADEALPADTAADSLLEVGLAATWVAATLLAACTPVQASGHAVSIEDPRSANLASGKIAFAEIASVTMTIAFATAASAASAS